MTPDLLIRLFTVLALLVLAAGSTLMVIAFLGGTPNPATPYDLGIAAGYAIALVWPFVLGVVWLLGALAFLAQRRLAAALILLLILAGVCALLQRVLYGIASMSAGTFPKRGLPAVLIVVIFLTVNAGAIYVAWRYIVRGGTNVFFP